MREGGLGGEGREDMREELGEMVRGGRGVDHEMGNDFGDSGDC